MYRHLPTKRNGGEREPMVVVSLDALHQIFDRAMAVVGIDEETLRMLPEMPKCAVEVNNPHLQATDEWNSNLARDRPPRPSPPLHASLFEHHPPQLAQVRPQFAAWLELCVERSLTPAEVAGLLE